MYENTFFFLQKLNPYYNILQNEKCYYILITCIEMYNNIIYNQIVKEKKKNTKELRGR